MSVRSLVTPVFAAIVAIGISLAAVSASDARVGSGFSFGSRGSNSFSAPPSTRTAPYVSPLPSQPGFGNQGLLRPSMGSRGLFGGFGRGLLGGLVGAGLIGMLFGHGFFAGGLFSLLGTLIQIALIFLIIRFAINMFRTRSAYAGATPGTSWRDNLGGGPAYGSGPIPGGAPVPPRTAPLEISKADYDAFEANLVGVQSAFSAEDMSALQRLATPEMSAHFAHELDQNRSRGGVNRISDVRLLQGDLSQSWSEPGADYASVAMRFSLIDAMIERSSGRVVAGDANSPQQVTEVWTFVRAPNSGPGGWRLSAIQQAR